MNTLLPYEQKWIANRLKIYRIKYAEIYNEVYDHILSACEDKRRNGDTRDILSLFQETIDQDIGSHNGIAQMTEEREYLIKKHLKDLMKNEFISFFNTTKAIWIVSIALTTYILAYMLSVELKWLFLVSLVTTWIPYLYFLAIGTKYGYLRTIVSKRKTSLINKLMFENTNLPIFGFHIALFTIPQLSALFVGGSLDYSIVKHITHFISYPGWSILMAVSIAYVASFVKVINTDYRRLIQQVH